jgi:hypothetical protein
VKVMMRNRSRLEIRNENIMKIRGTGGLMQWMKMRIRIRRWQKTDLQ